MNPRSGLILPAFTLIEVLVSLALIVLIGALVAPSLLSLSDRVTLESEADQVAAAAAQAAAEAVRRAEPVELIAVPDPKGVTLSARAVAASTENATDPSMRSPRPPAGDSAEDITQGATPSSAAWHLRLTHLDAPARVTTTDPRTTLDQNLPAQEFGADALIAPQGPPETRLAVFLPDGSVSGAVPLFLSRLDQVMQGTFSTLSGRLAFRRLPPIDRALRDDATTSDDAHPAQPPERTAPPDTPAAEDPAREPSTPRA